MSAVFAMSRTFSIRHYRLMVMNRSHILIFDEQLIRCNSTGMPFIRCIERTVRLPGIYMSCNVSSIWSHSWMPLSLRDRG